MNGYERIQAALNGKPTGKIPIMLHNFMMAAEEHEISMDQYRESPQLIADTFIKSIEKYSYDGILVDIDTVTLAGAVGVPVDFPEHEPARSPSGCLPGIDDIKKLKPVNIEMLLEYCTEVSCQFIRLMAQTGCDMVSNGDSPAGPEMISLEMYRRFALPWEKKLVEKSHELGLPYCLHICGNTDFILNDMLETGTDALELDYKTDIQKVYNRCRDKHTFIGNIDPSGVLARGSKKDVEEKVNELLDIYKSSPRLIVNAGCAIPPDTPEENIERLIEVTRSF